MTLTLVEEILGGEKILGRKIQNKIDLVELTREGIVKDAVFNLAQYLSLSWKQMADLLPVGEKTLVRYAGGQVLNSRVSEQVFRIAEVAAKGAVVFEDKGKFILWLNTPHKVFSGNTPYMLMNTGYGAELVLEELGRIESGVYV